MSKFNDTIPDAIKKIDNKISDLEWSKRDVSELGHECDCDFCDRDGEGADPDAEEKIEKINAEIDEYKVSRRRLVRYAEDHKIELKEKVAA